MKNRAELSRSYAPIPSISPPQTCPEESPDEDDGGAYEAWRAGALRAQASRPKTKTVRLNDAGLRSHGRGSTKDEPLSEEREQGATERYTGRDAEVEAASVVARPYSIQRHGDGSNLQVSSTQRAPPNQVPRLMLERVTRQTYAGPPGTPGQVQVADADLHIPKRQMVESRPGQDILVRDAGEELSGRDQRPLARVAKHHISQDGCADPGTQTCVTAAAAGRNARGEPSTPGGLCTRQKASLSRQLQAVWDGRAMTGISKPAQDEVNGARQQKPSPSVASAPASVPSTFGRVVSKLTQGQAADHRRLEAHESDRTAPEHSPPKTRPLHSSGNVATSAGTGERTQLHENARLKQLEEENARLKEEAEQAKARELSRLQQLENENARLKAALEEESRRSATKLSCEQSEESMMAHAGVSNADTSVHNESDSVEMRMRVEAMAMFRVLDADNDGLISKSDLLRGFLDERAVLEELVDVHDEGPVSFEDFWSVIVAGNMQDQVETETERLLLLRLAEEEEAARARPSCAHHDLPQAEGCGQDDGQGLTAGDDGLPESVTAAPEEEDGCLVARDPTPASSTTPDVVLKGVQCQSVEAEIAEQRRRQMDRDRATLESRGASERNVVEMQRRIFDQASTGAAPASGDQVHSIGRLKQHHGAQGQEDTNEAAPDTLLVNPLNADGISPRYRSLSETRSRENSPRVLPHHIIAVCGKGQRMARNPLSTHQASNGTAPAGTSDGDCKHAAGHVLGESEQPGSSTTGSEGRDQLEAVSGDCPGVPNKLHASPTPTATNATAPLEEDDADGEAGYACDTKTLGGSSMSDALRRLEIEISKLEKLDSTPLSSPLPPPSEALPSPPSVTALPACRQTDEVSCSRVLPHHARSVQADSSNKHTHGALPSRLDSSESEEDDRTPLKQGISFSSRMSRNVPMLQASSQASGNGGSRGVLVSAGKGKGTPSTPPPRHRPHTTTTQDGPQPLSLPGSGADSFAGIAVGAGFIDGRARRGRVREQETRPGCQEGVARSKAEEGHEAWAEVLAPGEGLLARGDSLMREKAVRC